MHDRPWIFALWLGMTGACVLPTPKNGGELMDSTDGAGGTGDAGESGGGETDGIGGSSGELPGSTGGEDTTGGDESTGEGDTTGGEPASVCDPQPEELTHVLGVDYDPEDPFLGATVELDVTCSVVALSSNGLFYSIELDCEDAPHVLDVLDVGTIDLMVGQTVSLRVHDSQPWWRHTNMVLLRDGEVIVAGMDSQELPFEDGNDYVPAAGFFAPLEVEVVPDVCRPEPLGDEVCNDFICERPCTQNERQAMRFSVGGDSVELHDRRTGSLGDLQIAVTRAQDHVQVLCVDTRAAWYRFVVMRTL